MKAPELVAAPDPGLAAEALIQEARRRQRKRRRAIGLAVVVAMAAAAGAFASSRPGSQLEPKSPAGGSRNSPAPGQVPGGIAATLVMWPVFSGPMPAFGPGCSGPEAYVDDLSTGRMSLRSIPCIAGGDYARTLLSVGRWVVYLTGSGVSAIPGNLEGHQRVLGNGTFAPSASPGQVWLETAGGGSSRAVVQSVSVGDGKRGPVIVLPAGTYLVEGTDAGLLLESQQGDVELWAPGAEPRQLAHLSNSGAWFAADPRLAAYASGCRDQTATPGSRPSFSYFPTFSYQACGTLRTVNLVTGKRLSFPAPPGTLGWVPHTFAAVNAISPGNTIIAAQAASRPARNGSGRFFLLSLPGSQRRPTVVPLSAAPVNADTAWAAGGSWLFYQGPGGRLRALQVATGTVRSFKAPCCDYAAEYGGMFTVPSPP
jgi:hypothetical protein